MLQAQILNPDQSDAANFSSQKAIKAQVTGWLQDLRSVTTDELAQKTLADHVYALMDGNGEAVGIVTNWYRSNDPVERAKTVHVEATVRNIVAQSNNSYEVYWEERETNLSDRDSGRTSRWRAVIQIAVRAPKTQADISANPYGVWIERITQPQKDNANE